MPIQIGTRNSPLKTTFKSNTQSTRNQLNAVGSYIVSNVPKPNGSFGKFSNRHTRVRNNNGAPGEYNGFDTSRYHSTNKYADRDQNSSYLKDHKMMFQHEAPVGNGLVFEHLSDT